MPAGSFARRRRDGLQLAGWLGGWVSGGWVSGWLGGWVAGWLAGWLALAGWLGGWAGWVAGWLAGWLCATAVRRWERRLAPRWRGARGCSAEAGSRRRRARGRRRGAEPLRAAWRTDLLRHEENGWTLLHIACGSRAGASARSPRGACRRGCRGVRGHRPFLYRRCLATRPPLLAARYGRTETMAVLGRRPTSTPAPATVTCAAFAAAHLQLGAPGAARGGRRLPAAHIARDRPRRDRRAGGRRRGRGGRWRLGLARR